VSVVCEVPSGAWADTVSRRLLLAVGSLLYASCFAVWILVPSGVGFALGFVLWGLSGALSSGTFQALAYDELVAIGRQDRYARLIGWGSALALAAVAVATLLAAPLMSLGGYALVGSVSVGVCLVQFAVVLSLPRTPAAVTVADAEELAEDEDAEPVRGGVLSAPDDDVWRRWWATLRDGVRVSRSNRVLRGAVLASGALMGLTVFDEYFGLVMREHGTAAHTIPLLLGAITAAQAVGGLLAERLEHTRSGVLAALAAGAGVTLAAGVLVGHPVVGAVLMALAYGTVTLLIVVTEVRLQHAAPPALRATVTSVSNVFAEALSIVMYAMVALASPVAGVVAIVAALAVAVTAGAPLLGRWLRETDRGSGDARSGGAAR